MSLSKEQWRVEYSLRCLKGDKQLTIKNERLEAIRACSIYATQTILEKKPKVIITLGSISCEAFLEGSSIKTKEGAEWSTVNSSGKIQTIFVGYSPAYSIQDPSEMPRLSRLLWKAAEHAGLKPKHNPNLKHINLDD